MGSIIFDEVQYAKDVLKTGFTTHMSQKDLNIVAKYFFYIGKKEKQIKYDLIEFCKKYNPTFNFVIDGYKIKNAIKHAKRYNINIPNEIYIRESEIDNIKKLKNYTYEKILFVMLVISKYINRKFEEIDEYKKDVFYVYLPFSQILNMSNVNLWGKNKNKILFTLEQSGLIRTTLRGSYEIKIVDVEKKSNIKIIVDDFDNIVDFYPFFCSVCGKETEKTGRNQFMCAECRKKKENDDAAERMRKKRAEK